MKSFSGKRDSFVKFTLSAIIISLIIAHTSFASIINIDSRLDTIANPIVINLDAGTYRILPIGVSGGGLYNAVNPWGDDPNGWYHVYSVSSLSINNNQYPSTFWENNRGIFQNYQSDLAALSNAPVDHFTLTSNEEVRFYISDSGYYWDNAGGISLDVAPVPIPPSVWLLGSGLIGLFGLRRGFTNFVLK